MGSIRNQLRQALRRLARRPMFTAITLQRSIASGTDQVINQKLRTAGFAWGGPRVQRHTPYSSDYLPRLEFSRPYFECIRCERRLSGALRGGEQHRREGCKGFVRPRRVNAKGAT